MDIRPTRRMPGYHKLEDEYAITLSPWERPPDGLRRKRFGMRIALFLTLVGMFMVPSAYLSMHVAPPTRMVQPARPYAPRFAYVQYAMDRLGACQNSTH